MIGLLCFALTVLASPFKSKLRLEAENAVLRHQLIVLKRRLHGRVRLTNNDRWFFIQMYRWRRHTPIARHGHPDKPTAPALPWQNGFAERLIGSIRRACLDHIIVLGEVHLRQILQSYARYYNDIRTHRSSDKDAPVSRQISESEASNHTPSLADFTTTTPELKFAVHTTGWGLSPDRP
jgi:transposase InsO family protein